MRPVVVKERRGENGVTVKEWDPCGAVFVPLRSANYPVFAFGHGKIKDPVFTCPVSAIPDQVWDLIDLFLQCRAMKLPPVAGGVLNQPYVVRRAWPILEAEMEPLERQRQQTGSIAAMATMLASVPMMRMPKGPRRR